MKQAKNLKNHGKKRAISLFSGAGGMDVGFKNAGFEILWANDINKDACDTYRKNHGENIHCGDITGYFDDLQNFENIDLLFGGPPCQGFSVAGKMDPSDSRSKLIWDYVKVLKIIRPKAFVCENVKALGLLDKWKFVRNKLVQATRELGYNTNFEILNASDFNSPQARERVFFIGFKNENHDFDLNKMLKPFLKKGKTVREALSVLDKAGTGNNTSICKAKVTMAASPIMRKSPYAGMLFNGLGRPVRINGYCATLPASMGGNKTPIIDEEELYFKKTSWVENYHKKLMNGGKPLPFGAPKRLRRLTLQEAAILQTFPKSYKFSGSQSSIYCQIGNAVPCNLAYAIGKMIFGVLNGKVNTIPVIKRQLTMSF